MGQRTKPTPDVPRAKPRAPLGTSGDGDGSASAPPNACEQVREISFRVAPGSSPAKGVAVSVRNGSPLALEANRRVVGTFADSTVSGCIAFGFAFDGEVTSVKGAVGTATIRGR